MIPSTRAASATARTAFRQSTLPFPSAGERDVCTVPRTLRPALVLRGLVGAVFPVGLLRRLRAFGASWEGGGSGVPNRSSTSSAVTARPCSS